MYLLPIKSRLVRRFGSSKRVATATSPKHPKEKYIDDNHIAIKYLWLLRLYITRGCKPHFHADSSPLYGALRTNCIRTIGFLLSVGNRNIGPELEITTLDQTRFLFQWGVDPNTGGWFHDHIDNVWEDKIDFIRLFIEAGADVNAKDVFGMTPLHWAALCERGEIYNELLTAGADDSIRCKGISAAYLTMGCAYVVRDMLLKIED